MYLLNGTKDLNDITHVDLAQRHLIGQYFVGKDCKQGEKDKKFVPWKSLLEISRYRESNMIKKTRIKVGKNIRPTKFCLIRYI